MKEGVAGIRSCAFANRPNSVLIVLVVVVLVTIVEVLVPCVSRRVLRFSPLSPSFAVA